MNNGYIVLHFTMPVIPDFEIEEANMLKHIRPSGIRKMFARAQGLKDVISLGIGMPDLMPPQELLDEMKNQMSNLRAHGYTLNAGIPSLREKIASQYKSVYNLDYDPNNIVVGAGGTQLLYTSIFAYTNPGDEVLVQDPGFVYYPTIPKFAKCKTIPLNLDDKFQVDEENLKSSITEKSKLMIINTPGNPTGGVFTNSTLKMIADLAIDNNILILSDEVYEFLTFDNRKHYPISELAPDHTVILNSFSKTYCITGWRMGFAVSNSKLIQPLAKLHPFVVANPPSLPQYALANFMGTKADIEFKVSMRKIMEERRDVVVKEFGKIDGLEMQPIEGSFYAFPRVRSEKYAGDNAGLEFSEDIFDKTKVVTVAGSEFGESRYEHVRISFGSVNSDMLREAAQRIIEYSA